MSTILLRSAVMGFVLAGMLGCAPTMEDFPKMQEEFKTSGSDDRTKTIAKIGEMSEPATEVFTFLCTVTKDDSTDSVRSAAIQSLVKLQANQSAACVEQALTQDKSEQVRKSAVAAYGKLAGIGSGTVLAKVAVDDSSAAVRSAALRQVCDSGGGQAFTVVSDRLKNDPDPEVRKTAAEMTGKLQMENALEVLQEVAKTDADAGVKAAAVRACGKIPGDESLKFLADSLKDENLRDAAISGLHENKRGHNSPAIVADLIAGAQKSDKIDQRLVEMFALSDSPAAGNYLLQSITGYSDSFGEDEFISKIVRTLKSQGSYSLVPKLREVLRTGKEARPMRNAAIALGRFGQNEAVPELMDIVNKRNSRVYDNVASSAIWALGSMKQGDHSLWNTLCTMKKTDKKEYSNKAAEALSIYYYGAKWDVKPQVCK